LAVIKQQRTTFASPIGVVRANTGAGAVFRGVNKIADQMIEESFRSAKQKALEAGEDLARSKELGSLRSINPATGLPEMSLMSTLAPPQEFGSIAQKAYKRVIESRYVSQIEQDFKLKAKELSMIENISPDLYSEKMSQYLEEMINSASSGQYKNMIEETGTFYLASTKMNLIETRRREQKIKNKQFFITNHTEVLKSFQDLDADDRILAYEKLIADIDLQIEADPNSYSGPEINALKKEGFDGVAPSSMSGSKAAGEELVIFDSSVLKK